MDRQVTIVQDRKRSAYMTEDRNGGRAWYRARHGTLEKRVGQILEKTRVGKTIGRAYTVGCIIEFFIFLFDFFH